MMKNFRRPHGDEQALLDQVRVRLVERSELKRLNRLLATHYYLGSLKPVGQRLHYVAVPVSGARRPLPLGVRNKVFSVPRCTFLHDDQLPLVAPRKATVSARLEGLIPGIIPTIDSDRRHVTLRPS